jgi:ribosomal protein S12 methylthiotransferase
LKKNTIINIITLGCAKNLVDSEVLMKQLEGSGFQVMHDSDDFAAKTVLINTCGFINDAKQESIDTILKFAQAKKNGRIDNLFVFGCLSQRYISELTEEIPEVDNWFGVNDFRRILNTLGGKYREELYGERILTTPSHYAYLKISEGCDRLCSFCAIPLIRGRQKSKSINEIITEANLLVTRGVKEIILIAQDLTAYGTDIYGERKLPELVDKLTDIKGVVWIRLHYAYPTNFPVHLLELIATRKQICKYIDLPFQHISDKVLSKMHRGINSSEILDLIKKIRDTVPGVAIRTTLLVGHPGEGDKEFSELYSFVESQEFERLGVFKYSEEEGTYSASNYRDIVPEVVKEKRLKEIMKLQSRISLKINEKKVGFNYNILVDSHEGKFAIGRTEHDSPEIDNEVLIYDPQLKLSPGEFYTAKIKSAENYDLYGEVTAE